MPSFRVPSKLSHLRLMIPASFAYCGSPMDHSTNSSRPAPWVA